eukprot:TRINITY_DN1305_c1_g2_i2.p1 TRINITY_DN1305_c1_g2~~TRINITY_DN1305_c1_g2_i2.p1  ORF type:complete len:368 (-),score=85.51 TRINITY_DN1305_c1_g2_i2:340-1443(-)
MAYQWMFLVDPGTFFLLCVACCTIFYGSYRSVHLPAFFRAGPNQAPESSSMKLWTAILLPVFGSVFLVVLFFFSSIVIWILMAIISLSCLTSVTYVVYPLSEKLFAHYQAERTYNIRWVGDTPRSAIASFVFAVLLVVLWWCWPYYLVGDLLAIALAIAALTFVRIPNLKIATIVLTLFFIYDIFWVFLSGLIFKKSVMEEVAVSVAPSLPIVIVFPRMLDYPASSLLGLGDIVLPGIFLCFLYRFDHLRYTSLRDGYFLRGWLAYFCGLVLTLIMLVMLQKGQPALLYLVPCTLLTTVYFGYKRGELRDLWRGYPESVQPPVVVTSGAEDEMALLEEGRAVEPEPTDAADPGTTPADSKQLQQVTL